MVGSRRPDRLPGRYGADMNAVPSPRQRWSRWLEVAWTALAAVVLVAGVVAGNWFWVLLAGLALVGELLGLHQTRPAAVQERSRQETEALAEWTPERLRQLADEQGIDPGQAPVALIAAVRKADPRLSLVGAKQLVDGVLPG